MLTVVYQDWLFDTFRGRIAHDAIEVGVMLVTAEYVPDPAKHARRSDVTGEVVAEGYAAGGVKTASKLKRGTGGIEIVLGGARWAESSITAHGAVYFVRRGKAADDELILYVGFDGDVISSNGAFSLGESTIPIHKA
jgi:hypothetical protein